VKNLEAWFRVELTYTSNAIEGNTLSRRETAVVIEKGLTVGGKSLKEHLEATNHAHAVDYVTSLVGRRSRSVSEQEILRLHCRTRSRRLRSGVHASGGGA
jgi:Fic family protein